MTSIKIHQVLILQFSRNIDMVKVTIFQVEIILINFTSHLLVNLMRRREKMFTIFGQLRSSLGNVQLILSMLYRISSGLGLHYIRFRRIFK